jgi:PAS domain S-box-containing protein
MRHPVSPSGITQDNDETSMADQQGNTPNGKTRDIKNQHDDEHMLTSNISPMMPSRQPLLNVNVEKRQQQNVFAAWMGIVSVFIFVAMLVTGYMQALMEDVPSWVTGIFIASSIIYSISIMFFITFIARKMSENDDEFVQVTQESYRIQRQTIQLEVAALIARDAAQAPDMNSILQRATQLIHERFGFYHAGIFMIEDDYAVLRAASGSTQGSIDMLQAGHRLRVGEEGIIGAVAILGQARIALDVTMDRTHYVNPHLPDTRAEMAIPLKMDNAVVAILDVQSQQAGAFDDEDVRILQIMADLLTITLNKTQLNETVQAYAQQLEKRVAERTAELANERAQLQAILDNMQEGVIYHRGDIPLYTNIAFNDLFQLPAPEAWQGLRKIIVSLPNKDSEQIYEELAQAFYEHRHYRRDLRLKRLDGSEFDASVSCTAIDDGNRAVVTVIRDISQEKALQEQKQRFLAYASHELRTPITNLKTRLYLLKKQPQRFNDHFNIINQVVGRMQWLVDDLLNHTRLEQGRITLNYDTYSIQDLLENIIQTQKPEADIKNITLSNELPSAPLMLSFDWERLLQVFTNLIANAINYTPKGGKVRVHLEQDANNVHIHIVDNGIGIPESTQEILFQPFVRGENVDMKGTGLGLVISRQIVELHEGTLTFKSREGEGSVFMVSLANKAMTSPYNDGNTV